MVMGSVDAVVVVRRSVFVIVVLDCSCVSKAKQAKLAKQS